MLCADPSTDTPSFLVGPDGRICWNREKDYQKWIWIRGRDGLNNPAPIIQAGRTQVLTHQVSPEGPASGDVEVCALLGSFATDFGTARFSVVLRDSRTKRQYMNSPAVSTHVYGIMTLPGGFGAPIYVPATQALQVELTNLEAVSAIPKVTMYGRRFVGPGATNLEVRRRAAFFSQRIQPYWLTPDTGPVVPLAAAGGAGDSATIHMTVPGSAYFDAMWLLDDSTADYEVQIFEGTEMRSLMDGPTPSAHVFTGNVGGSSIGFAPLRVCRWSHGFSPTTQLTFVVRNLSPAPNDIRISAHGRLVYVDSDHTPVLDAAMRYIPSQPGPYGNPAAGSCQPCDPSTFVPGMFAMPGYAQGPMGYGPVGVVSPGAAPSGIVPLNTPPLPPPGVVPWSALQGSGQLHALQQAQLRASMAQQTPTQQQQAQLRAAALAQLHQPGQQGLVASPASMAYAQQYRMPAPGQPGAFPTAAQAAAAQGGGTYGTV